MRIPKDKNILFYLQEQGIHLDAPCNGKGTCGKCKVIIKDTNPLPIEEEKLSKEELSNFVRLACLRKTTKPTDIKLINKEDFASKDAYYKKPKIFDPYLRLKKSASHYDVLRNQKKLRETSTLKAYGLAVDIGTTTIAFALLDLINGNILDYQTLTNPQSAYGSDVISRIDYAKEEEKRTKLSSLIRKAIDDQTHHILRNHQVKQENLYELVIAANTTMVYLLLNEDPSSLAQAPYTAEILNRIETSYKELFNSPLQARVTIYQGLDAYIGGDIVSGIISEDLHKKKDYHMLIDLGTNGEIVLLNKEHIYASATALGPAFEGVNITCGVGAIKGAIDHFTYPDLVHTIEDKEPKGLCGSGLIDLVSELVNNEVISSNGRMKNPFFLNKDIFLNQEDVRQIQLAKAALKAGIEHLAIDADIPLSSIKKLYIAGGFGQYTDPLKLMDIGMIPSAFQGKIEILGNASLNGAIKFLSSPIEETYFDQHKVHIRTLTTPLFQDLFVANMHFPNQKHKQS